MAIRGVLFDLDETLNDRALSWRKFVQFLAENGGLLGDGSDVDGVCRIVLEADAGGYRPKGELFQELCAKLPWKIRPEAEELEALWRERFPACMVVQAGVAELIKALRSAGIRVGIVSNGREDMQTAKIEAMGLKALMDCVVISGAVGIKKPDRRIYEMALAALAVSARETLFVGDHPVLDVEGPRAAGMKTAWIRIAKQWPQGIAPADYVVRNIAEIRDIVGIG